MSTTTSENRPAKLDAAIEKRQSEFLAGRSLSMLAQSALGRAPEPVSPFGGRAPIWPTGLAGSISHARGHCACFLLPVTKGHPGVDIETVTTGKALKSIQKMVLLRGEREIIEQADLPSNVAATLVFSAKETLFKALYPVVQRHFGFPAAEMVDPPDTSHLTLQLTETLHPLLPAGRRFLIRFQVDSATVLTWSLFTP